MTNDTNHEELRKLALAATAGPWKRAIGAAYYQVEDSDGKLISFIGMTWEDKANAAYIAAASPQTVLALLDHMDALLDASKLYMIAVHRLDIATRYGADKHDAVAEFIRAEGMLYAAIDQCEHEHELAHAAARPMDESPAKVWISAENAQQAALLQERDLEINRLGFINSALGDDTEKLEQRIRELESALEELIEMVGEPPDRNCSCHLNPPCNDCVEYGGLRQALERARAAIAQKGAQQG